MVIAKKILFTIRETVWWIVAELEDWLYPYEDREVTRPLWSEDFDNLTLDQSKYLKSQIDCNNDRIVRLQNEMIFVIKEIRKLENHGQK